MNQQQVSKKKCVRNNSTKRKHFLCENPKAIWTFRWQKKKPISFAHSRREKKTDLKIRKKIEKKVSLTYFSLHFSKSLYGPLKFNLICFRLYFRSLIFFILYFLRLFSSHHSTEFLLRIYFWNLTHNTENIPITLFKT